MAQQNKPDPKSNLKPVKPNLGSFPNIPASPPPSKLSSQQSSNPVANPKASSEGGHSDFKKVDVPQKADASLKAPVTTTKEGGGYKNQYKAAEEDDRGSDEGNTPEEAEDSLGYTRNSSEKPLGSYKGDAKPNSSGPTKTKSSSSTRH